MSARTLNTITSQSQTDYMSDINDLIARQAMAVKGNSNAIAAAEKLEEAARLLRAGAEPVKKFYFKEVAQAKRARIDKFANAFAKAKDQDMKDALAQAKWTCIGWDPIKKISNWRTAARPGYVLFVTGSQFKVMNGSDIVISETHIRDIASALKRLQKK